MFPASRTAALAALLLATTGLTACSHERETAAATEMCVSTAKQNPAAAANPHIPSAAVDASLGQADGCVFRGAGDFTLDVSKCPADYDINAGITADKIRLFTSMPHSGALAAYGYIGDGLKNYLAYVNANGGVGGRTIELDIMDDQYQPDLTRKNVDKAIQSGTYAASAAILGSSNNGAIRDVMNDECMPHLLVASSEDRWGDPEHYPWTTGMGLNYGNEAGLWKRWLSDKYPDGTTVAFVAMNNDFGKAYQQSFTRAAEGSSIKIVANELIDPAAPNMTDQLTSAAASKAEVAIFAVAGTFCVQAIGGVERSSWKPVVITGNSCAQIETSLAPLQKEGLTGNGTHVVQYYYNPEDPANAAPEFAKLYTEEMTKGGLDPHVAQYANGWFWGWYLVAILRDADTMKGGLNRANIAVAARSITQPYPLLVSGLTSKFNGLQDAYLFEGGQMFRYEGATKSKVGAWEPASELLNREGRTGTFTKINLQ
ncbi:ABC transporter substrate-binding protein [Nonomuraea sp. LP-02]|uniref:ABC transporter substrate-binding protein n=1 Tax=Nonomuraea sp. LP-02 TaxID=3097960 RepID=UPI002E2FF4A3|nr:ABC transporter substrate-binding protein [Nonomuraea sp. LP-02]MED7931602.1 ABC transporter substrate-binding protein [Nonomuraea sp. LP-02]